jgi:anti-sigma factor RsiW
MVQHVYHLLNDYYDDELSPVASRRVEAHLAECTRCQAALAQLSQLGDLLSEYRVPDAFGAAETFRAQVALRVARRQMERSGYRGAAWHLVPLALLSVVVLVQALLTLSGAVGILARSLGWLGIDLDLVLAQVGISWSQAGSAFGLSMVGLFFVLLVVGAYLGLIVLFVPYAGWVGALLRSVRTGQASRRL